MWRCSALWPAEQSTLPRWASVSPVGIWAGKIQWLRIHSCSHSVLCSVWHPILWFQVLLCFFKTSAYLYVCEWVSVCVCVCGCVIFLCIMFPFGTLGHKRPLGPLDLELQMALHHLAWVLGSSTRAVSAPNCWATFPAPNTGSSQYLLNKQTVKVLSHFICWTEVLTHRQNESDEILWSKMVRCASKRQTDEILLPFHLWMRLFYQMEPSRRPEQRGNTLHFKWEPFVAYSQTTVAPWRSNLLYTAGNMTSPNTVN